MATTIESLELEIKSNGTTAASGIEALEQSLRKLKDATSGLRLSSVANSIGRIAEAVNRVDAASVSKMGALASAMQRLSQVGKISIPASVVTRITEISASANNIPSDIITRLSNLAGGLSALSNVGEVHIPANLANTITNIGIAAEQIQGISFDPLIQMAQGVSALAGIGQITISSSIANQLVNIGAAAQGLDGVSFAQIPALATALMSLQSVGQLTISSSIANQLVNLGIAAGQLQGISFAPITELGTALSSLTGIAGLTISSSLASQITRIATAAQGLQGVPINLITDLGTALASFNAIGELRISASIANQITRIATAAATLTNGQIDAIQRLGSALESLGRGYSSLPAQVNNSATAINRLSVSMQRNTTQSAKMHKANNKIGLSFVNLWAKARMAYNVIKQGARIIGEWINQANKYIEDANLFNVSLGEYADEAKKYAEQVSEVMGIDPAEWMRNQGVFNTIITGFGVSADKAYLMSKNLTQLGYDLSSFYNISVSDAMTKLESGIAGELEPLRRLGYDLSVARLQEEALALGIKKKVSKMTQAEKSQLRYYAILTQVTKAQGDMARTLDAPANQLRVLQAQLTQLARAMGNLFIPVLNKVLPYAIAIAKVLRQIINSLATLLGITLPEVDYSSVTGGSTAVKEAAETNDTLSRLKNTVMGFDEVNALQTQKSSSSNMVSDLSEDADTATAAVKELKRTMMGFDELNPLKKDKDDGADSGTIDIDLPEYDFLGGAVQTRIDEIVDKINAALSRIQAKAQAVFQVFKDAWEQYGKPVVNAFESALNSVIGVIDLIGDTLYKVFTQGYGYEWLVSVLGLLQSSLEIIDAIASTFATAWNDNGNGYNYIASIFSMITKVNNLLITLKTSFANAWNNGIGVKIWTNILQIATNVHNIIGNIADAFRTAWEDGGRGEKVWNDLLIIINTVLDHLNTITEFTANWAADLDFGPIIDAFDGFLLAVTPVIDFICDTLSWAYTNVLLPIAKWVIEKAAPDSVDLFSAALGALHTVIEALKPFATYIWENFLQPIGKWTGEIIIAAIQGLTTALQGLSDWAKENPDLFQAWAERIAIFVAACMGINALTGVFTMLHGFGVAFHTFTGTVASNIATNSQRIATFFTTAWGHITTFITNAIQFLTTHAAAIGTAALAVLDAFMVVYDITALNDAATGYKDAFNAHQNEIDTALNSYTQLYQTKGKEIADEWANTVYQIDTSNMSLAEAQKAITERVEGYWDGVPLNMWEGFKQGWGTYFGDGATKGGLLALMGDAFSGAVMSVRNLLGIESPSTVFAEIGTNIVLGTNAGFTETWPLFTENADSSVNGLITDVQTTLGASEGMPSTVFNGIGTSMVMGAGEGFSTQWQIFSADADAMTNNLVLNEQTLMSDAVGSGITTDWVSGMQSGYATEWATFSADAQANANTLMTDERNIMSSQAGQNITSDLVTGMNTSFASRWTSFSRMADQNARQLMQNQRNVMSQSEGSSIGNNLVSGIYNGTGSAWSGLISFVQNLANNLINSVKRIFGIASPSKVFAGIGENLDAGLENGLNSGKGSLLDTVGSISKAVGDTFNPNMTIEPQVEPVRNAYAFADMGLTAEENLQVEADNESAAVSSIATMLVEMLGIMRQGESNGSNRDTKIIIDGREIFNVVVRENNRAINRTGASPIRV